MGMLRKPQTQSERRADHGHAADPETAPAKARLRGTKKDERTLPSDWADLFVAANADRGRGKPGHSPARKASAKARGQRFD